MGLVFNITESIRDNFGAKAKDSIVEKFLKEWLKNAKKRSTKNRKFPEALDAVTGTTSDSDENSD